MNFTAKNAKTNSILGCFSKVFATITFKTRNTEIGIPRIVNGIRHYDLDNTASDLHNMASHFFSCNRLSGHMEFFGCIVGSVLTHVMYTLCLTVSNDEAMKYRLDFCICLPVYIPAALFRSRFQSAVWKQPYGGRSTLEITAGGSCNSPKTEQYMEINCGPTHHMYTVFSCRCHIFICLRQIGLPFSFLQCLLAPLLG